MSKTTLSKPVILGLKGGLAKAYKRLEAANKRTEAETEPQLEIQAQTEDDNGGGSAVSHPSFSPTTPSSPGAIPQTYVLRPGLTPQEVGKYTKMTKDALIGEVVELKAQNASLQGQSQFNRNNGHGNDGYENPDIAKQKARIFKIYGDWMEQQTIENMAEKMRNPKGAEKENSIEKFLLELVTKTVLNQKGEQLGVKEMIELLKVMSGSSMKETIGLVDYIQRKGAEGQAVTLNDISLKLEQMKQLGHIEDKKLDFELMKWERQQESEASKWDLIKDGLKTLSSGPVGKAIESIGAGAADRLRGKGRSVEPVKLDCPSCHKPIYADPKAQQVVCASCGAVLEKKTEPAPQPQPEQPQPESQPSPEPSADVSSDAEKPEKQKSETKAEEVM